MIEALAALFTALQIADGVTTYQGINRGVASEGFLLQRKLIEKLGLAPGIIVMKAAMAALAWLAAIYAPGAVTMIVLAVACAFYAVIAFRNIRLIRKANRRI